MSGASPAKWGSGKTTLFDDLAALWFNKVPRSLRPLGLMHHSWRLSLAASGPMVAWVTTDRVTLPVALLASGTLFGGHLVLGVLDAASKEKSGKSPDPQDLAIRAGEIFAMQGPPDPEQRDQILRSALGFIHKYASVVTKLDSANISVSLSTYVGNSTEKMEIRYRNPGNERPVGKQFPCKHVLGHHACRGGMDPRVVNDIRRYQEEFRRSPTRAKADYRSLLIIPLESARNGQSRVVGFISVDAKQPYAFYGTRAHTIVVGCEPVIILIQGIV